MASLIFILGMVTGILLVLAAVGWARHLELKSVDSLEGVGK